MIINYKSKNLHRAEYIETKIYDADTTHTQLYRMAITEIELM